MTLIATYLPCAWWKLMDISVQERVNNIYSWYKYVVYDIRSYIRICHKIMIIYNTIVLAVTSCGCI